MDIEQQLNDTKNDVKELIKAIRQFAYTTGIGNGVSHLIPNGDVDAALKALEAMQKRERTQAEEKHALELRVRELENEKRVVQSYFGVPTEE